MKILVTGAGGLLGGELSRRLPLQGHEVTSVTHRELDITEPSAVVAAVRALRPDVVVNCAAFAAVDAAQADPAAAFAVNRDGPRHLAKAAADAGATLVHVSTDYVFGRTPRVPLRPYAPDEATDPAQLYGESKRAGEEAVLAAGDHHLVVRVSWLFGGDRAGFVAPVLRAAREGRPLRLVSDSVSRPTWTRTVAETLPRLVEEGARGIWHLCDGGETSRLDQARTVLALAGVEAETETVTRAELWPQVPRPAYSVLDLSATEALLGRPLAPWTETVQRYLEELGVTIR